MYPGSRRVRFPFLLYVQYLVSCRDSIRRCCDCSQVCYNYNHQTTTKTTLLPIIPPPQLPHVSTSSPLNYNRINHCLSHHLNLIQLYLADLTRFLYVFKNAEILLVICTLCILCPFAVYFVRYRVRLFFTISRIFLVSGTIK